MCGRITLGNSIEKLEQFLEDIFRIRKLNLDTILPRFNVAPGQDVVAVINDGNTNRAGLLKWGVISDQTKTEDKKFMMINIRSETLLAKPYFSRWMQAKRCVILADGFYEWKKDNKKKTPMCIVQENRTFFAIAGLWQTQVDENNQKTHTCVVITIPANDDVSSIHDRMPAILSDEQLNEWLNPNMKDLQLLNLILNAQTKKPLLAYQVSTLVNNPSNESSECITPV